MATLIETSLFYYKAYSNWGGGYRDALHTAKYLTFLSPDYYKFCHSNV